MAMSQHPDRDISYMHQMWGTTRLITDYWTLPTKKENRFKIQNEIHAEIRNDEDYDDWEYGTEPLYGERRGK